jgi:hypothetical protein
MFVAKVHKPFWHGLLENVEFIFFGEALTKMIFTEVIWDFSHEYFGPLLCGMYLTWYLP